MRKSCSFSRARGCRRRRSPRPCPVTERRAWLAPEPRRDFPVSFFFTGTWWHVCGPTGLRLSLPRRAFPFSSQARQSSGRVATRWLSGTGGFSPRRTPSEREARTVQGSLRGCEMKMPSDNPRGARKKREHPVLGGEMQAFWRLHLSARRICVPAPPCMAAPAPS